MGAWLDGLRGTDGYRGTAGVAGVIFFSGGIFFPHAMIHGCAATISSQNCSIEKAKNSSLGPDVFFFRGPMWRAWILN